MISRYVLWNTVDPPSAPEPVAAALKPALHLPIDNLESVVPTSLAAATRIAVREFLLVNDVGCELAIDTETQPLWLASCCQTPIAEMGLSVRSSNCLEAGSVATLEDLLAWTPNRLLSLEHFGRTCLNEITALLGDLGYAAADGNSSFLKGPRIASPSNDGCPLACLLTVQEVVPEGPLRTKLEMCGWTTLGDIASHALSEASSLADLTQEEQNALQEIIVKLSLKLPVLEPYWVAAHLSELRRVFSLELGAFVDAFNGGDNQHVSISVGFTENSSSLTEELGRLIPPNYNAQKRSVVTALFGLDGSDPLTLEEVAKQQIPPMTRERIRQIGSPFLDGLTQGSRILIWLQKALAILVEEVPCTNLHAETALIERGIITSRLSVTSILKLLQRAGLGHCLTIDSGLLLSEEVLSVLKAAVSSARKSSSHWGVADWEEIKAPLAEYAQILRPIFPNVTWLGNSERYFVFPDAENSLANRLARMLHVSPRLTLSSAYDAIFRDIRVDRARLPRKLFSAFCEVWPWCKLDGDEIVAFGKLPAAEASGDDLLVILIREFGRPVTRHEILQRARLEGISDVTVQNSLSYSNVLTGGDGLYWVIGDPPPIEVDDPPSTTNLESAPLMEHPTEVVVLAPLAASSSTEHVSSVSVRRSPRLTRRGRKVKGYWECVLRSMLPV